MGGIGTIAGIATPAAGGTSTATARTTVMVTLMGKRRCLETRLKMDLVATTTTAAAVVALMGVTAVTDRVTLAISLVAMETKAIRTSSLFLVKGAFRTA